MKRILWLLGVLLLGACGQTQEPAETQSEPPKEEIQSVQIVETRWGKPQWTLDADRIVLGAETTRVYPVRLTFYDEEGAVSSHLVADSGWVMEKTRDLVAMGQVTVITEDSTRLETSILRWDNRERKILTDQEVTIYRKDRILKGKGLVSDAGLEKIEIGGRVIGHEEPEPGSQR